MGHSGTNVLGLHGDSGDELYDDDGGDPKNPTKFSKQLQELKEIGEQVARLKTQ